MKVYRATDLLKAVRGELDRSRLHTEKRDVHLKGGKTIQANRWVAPEDVTKLTPPKALPFTPILSQKQQGASSAGSEGKGEEYQPRLPGMPSSKLRFEDVPPEKRFDSVWLVRAKELIDFGPDNKTVVDRLMALQKDLFGGLAGQYNLPEEVIIASASHEIEEFLEREKEGVDIGRSWYTANQDKARASLTAMYPSLADDAQWDFMCLLISVSSPKHSPDRNLRVALQWYEHYLDRGEVLPLHPTTGKAWGLAGKAIQKKAEQINMLLKDHKGDVGTMMAWLRSPSTVGEVRREAKRLGSSADILGKDSDPVDMRARMFGHKFSAFYENLSGGIARATIDTWAIRSYQRWRGVVEPFLNSQGAIEVNTKVSLSTKYDIEKLFVKLGEKFGLYPKQVQAILWYYEKRLYERIDTEGAVTKTGKSRTKRRGGNTSEVSFMEVAKEIFDERTAGINPFADKVRGSRRNKKPDGSGKVPDLPGVAPSDAGSVGGSGQGASLSKAEDRQGRPRLALLKHKYLARLGGPRDWSYIYKWPGQDKPPQKMDRVGLSAMTTPMGDSEYHHRASTKRPAYYRNVGSGDTVVQAHPAEVDAPKTLAEWEQEQSERESAIRRKAEEALARVNASKAAMFRSPGRSYYYILHPSTRTKGAWQVSIFDLKDIPTGHFEFDTADEACHSIFGGGKHAAAIGDRTFEMVHVSKALMIVHLWKARRTVMTVRRREGKQRGTESNCKIQAHVDFQGLNVSIENMVGTVREGTDSSGNRWQTLMRHAYGYILRSEGSDGDHVDCYVGPRRGSSRVFIVHQNDPHTGKYDEDKVMLGFDTAQEARQAYLEQYDNPSFFGSMDSVDIDRFREMLRDCNGVKLKKAIGEATHPEMHYVGGQHPHTQIYHVGRKEPAKLEGHEVLHHMGDRGGMEGGGGALKIRMADGSFAVMKYGDNVGQLHDENTANAIYAVMGIGAHRSKIMNEDGKPVLVADWLEGYTTYSKLDEDDKMSCRYALQDGFVVDALLANRDVLGMNTDNIFYNPQNGKVVRIDNGGALRYRAMGEEKGEKFKDYVGELKTMRDPERTAGKFFGDMTQKQIAEQIERIQQKRSAILNAIEDDWLRDKITKRIDSLTAQKALHPEKIVVRRKSGKTFQQTFHVADQKAKLVVGKLGDIYDTLPRTPIREEIARRKIIEATVGNPIEKRRDQKAHFDRLRKLGVRPLDSVIAEIAVGAHGIGVAGTRAAWMAMSDAQKADILKSIAKRLGMDDTAKKLKADNWWKSASWIEKKARDAEQDGIVLDTDLKDVIVLAVVDRMAKIDEMIYGAEAAQETAAKLQPILERITAKTALVETNVPAGLRGAMATTVMTEFHNHVEAGRLNDVPAMERSQKKLVAIEAWITKELDRWTARAELLAKEPVDVAAVKARIRSAMKTCDGYSKKKRVEYAIIVGRNGKVLGEHEGTKDKVEIGDGVPYLHAHALVHNHPADLKGGSFTVMRGGKVVSTHTLMSGGEFTLSGADLGYANTWRMNEVYAVAEKHIYKMTLTTHYPVTFFKRAIEEAAAAVTMKHGLGYEYKHPHAYQRAYVKLLAKQCGWKYEEIKKEW